MAGVKQARAYMRAEMETAFQSSVVEFGELRSRLTPFRKKTLEDSGKQEEQIDILASNALALITSHFNNVGKAVVKLYGECEINHFAVTDAHRKAVHDAERPAKYLLKSIMDRGRSSPGEWQLILASFWIPAKSLEGYLAPFGVSVKKWPATAMAIDAIFEELKRWEEAIKKFKVAVMRYLASSQFTQVVHMHRLVERYHIGDENKQGDDALQEANADAQDDDPSGGIGKVEYDSDADIDEHDEEAQTALLRREAESFLKMGKSKHAGDDDDGDEEVNADDDDDDDDPDLKPDRAVKKGGKMLRRRNAQQISRLKAQAANHVEGFDDSSESEEEMEGVDSDGMPKPARDKDDDRESDDEESRDYEFKPDKSADSGDDADDANDASKESEDASVKSDDRGKGKRNAGGSGAGDDDDDDEDNNDFDDDDDDDADDGADGSDQPKKSVKKRAAAPKKEKTVAAASPPTKKAKPTPTSAPVAANPQPTPAPPPLITAADPAYDPFGDIDI